MHRPVALTVRAPDSKSGCWGFESLLACQILKEKTLMFNQTIDFLRESKNELGKVVFPSRQEVIGATVVVIASVVVVSLFLGVVDIGLSKLISNIIK